VNKNQITFRHKIFIPKPLEVVWDFTQNYDLRPGWDKSIIEAKVIQTLPHRIVRFTTRGNITIVFEYKLDDRPNKTSLAIKETNSKWIIGGGGSCAYEGENGGTWWSQTNTIIWSPELSRERQLYMKSSFGGIIPIYLRSAGVMG
jgi:hypothetical protein